MSELEKLARDLCWAGFVTKPSTTKAAYWKSMPDRSRHTYIADALRLIWQIRKLGPDRIIAIAMEAEIQK